MQEQLETGIAAPLYPSRPPMQSGVPSQVLLTVISYLFDHEFHVHIGFTYVVSLPVASLTCSISISEDSSRLLICRAANVSCHSSGGLSPSG